MAITEKTRLGLRQAFADLLGEDLADAAMEAMPNLDYDQLATKTDVDHVRIELRGEMAELRSEIKGDMAELRSELKGDMAELRGEFAELRGEFADVRGDFGRLEGSLRYDMAVNLRITVLTHVATMIALAGTIVGFS